MNNKEAYRKLCYQEDCTIPIFSRGWWLDAVANDEWEVALVYKDGSIYASLPYVKKSKFGLVTISQPMLTQTLGPWIKPVKGKYSTRLSREKELMGELIDQLPIYARYQQSWSSTVTNWLPFYWRGFRQTSFYTYVIEDIKNAEETIKNFEGRKRTSIRKSKAEVEIIYDLSPEEFYENHVYTLEKQGELISYPKNAFMSIYKAVEEQGCGKIIGAVDKENKLHAAIFLVWDNEKAYVLITTIDSDFKRYGAASYVILESIRYASRFVNKFDFEGSMIESVERSYRQFGAKQESYSHITRTPSRILKFLDFIREVRG